MYLQLSPAKLPPKGLLRHSMHQGGPPTPRNPTRTARHCDYCLCRPEDPASEARLIHDSEVGILFAEAVADGAILFRAFWNTLVWSLLLALILRAVLFYIEFFGRYRKKTLFITLANLVVVFAYFFTNVTTDLITA